MKKFLTDSILVLLLFPGIRCQEEFTPDRPRVYTHPVQNIIANTGATFHGFVENPNNREIIGHGFHWSIETPGDNPEYLVDMGTFEGGDFSLDVRSTFQSGQRVAVRAFAETAEHRIYGEEVNFLALGSEGPRIDYSSPNVLQPGDTLTIYGKNLLPPMSLRLSSAYGNASHMEIAASKVSNTSIKVIMPSDLTGSLLGVVNGLGMSFPLQEPIDSRPPAWRSIGIYPGQSFNMPVCFTIGAKGYFGMGQFSDSFWEYDPALNQWSQIASFPGGERLWPSSFVINGKAYVGLGVNPDNSQENDDIWEYDPATGAWNQKSDFPGGERRRAISFTASGVAYIGGGDHFSTTKFDLWAYSPGSDSWNQKGNIPVATIFPAFEYQNKGYYLAGASICIYNQIADSWTVNPLPPILGSNDWLMAFDDRIIVGGFTQLIPDQQVVAEIPSCTDVDLYYYPGNFVVSGKGYVILMHPGDLPDVIEFDPSKL